MSHNNNIKRSIVWPHFDKVYESDRTAVCNYCAKRLTYNSSVTNLKKHLDRKHPFVFKGAVQGRSSTNLIKLSSPRPSSPHVDHTIQTQVDHIIQPQEEINESQKESHENKKTYVYFKDMKLLLEKALDKEDSIREKQRPKRRIIQQRDIEEVSVKKLKPTQTSNGLHEEIDGDKHFALSLIPTLKQMTDDQKLTAKMRILQVLQEVRKMNTSQSIVYMEDMSTEDASKVEYLDEDTSASS